jgi:signal transduction histidine kinase
MVRSVLLCDTTADAPALRGAIVGDPDLFVDVSTDARKALEIAARTRPDVIVCRIPRSDFPGAEFVARVLASSPTSCVLARVPADDAALGAAALQVGAHGVVTTLDDVALPGVIASARPDAVVMSAVASGRLSTGLLGARGEASQLSADLDDLRRTVAQGTSAKADFLSNISHELRTPVTVAKGIAYVLRNPGVSDEEREEFLTQLQASLDRLMGVLDEIITMSELERGTLELTLELVDLAPTVRHAVDACRDRHPDVSIDASIAPSLTTTCDQARIEGVIVELLDNACRYSPPDATVELAARSMSEGVVVSVTDRGEGLDRTVAMRSFAEPFTTGEGVMRKEKAGVGVGLHLARQLVVEHGGTLWVDPLPGGGTRAAFCLPPVGQLHAEPSDAA